MPAFRYGIILLLITGSLCSYGQNTGFESFIDRLEEQYKVDVAVAPELIPTLDSIRHVGPDITSIEELLRHLLDQSGITYQVVDGNKIMLRREYSGEQKQIVAILQGTMMDMNSGEPLAFANVFVPYTNTGCHTDEQGYFILPVNDTVGEIRFAYLGYKDQTLPIRTLMRGNIEVRMEILKIPLKEVIIVVPYKLMDIDHSQQSTDLKGYQFISEDQLLNWNAERLLTSLTTYTHYSSDEGIRIRGSDESNSLILMDEIPVYDPYHFYNIFSPFNGQYFSSVEVYKNNLPIEYGGRIDGMIRVQSERVKPNSKLILDTDLLLTSLTTELVITPNIHLTASGRLSHTDMLNDDFSDSSSTNFSLPGKFKDENEWSTSQQPTSDFYDVNVGLAIQPGVNSKLRFNFFDSQDQLDNTTYTEFETTIQNHEIISVEQSYTSYDDWKNRGLAAEWYSLLGKANSLKVLGYHSGFEKDVEYTSYFEESRPGMHKINTHSGYQNSDLITTGIKAFLQHSFSTNASATLGAELQDYQVEFTAKENNTPFLTQSQSEKETTLFGEYRQKVWEKLEWTLGSRFTYLQSTAQMYFLPNTRINYAFDERYSIRGSYSKNLQALHELTIENRFGREMDYLVLSEPESGYPVLKSDKYMIGAGFKTTYLSLDAEWYYKKMNGLVSVRPLQPDPSFGDPLTPDDFYQLLDGDGWTAGMDIVLLYKKKKFEASMLYTLSKIAERYERLFNGNYFSPQEDRRHQLKTAVGYTIGKFKITSLLNYKSEAPYISLVRLEGHDGLEMADQGEVYRYLPPYFSIDLGLDYSFKLFLQPAMIGVSLINATNHENINDLQHLGKVTRAGGRDLYLTNQTELLGRTFNVHFRYLIN